MAAIRERYNEIFTTCARSPGGFEHEPDRRGFYDVSPEQRRELWDRLYDEPGFGIWLQNFTEIFVDEKANAELSDYIADRIRQRVNDPVLAERLIPKDHGFGIQRVPLETGYFETYNRDNVELVDSAETPIVRITPTGLETSDGAFEFDVIVYATGFDAFTGAFDQIDIQGTGGGRLRDKWAAGPVTYLGAMTRGFPNFLMLVGPQTAASNFPRGAELSVDWVTPFLEHMWAQGHHRFDVDEAAEAEWVEHVKDMYKGVLLRNAKSWFTGYNSNIDGHEYGKTRYNIYNGGGPRYARKLSEVADNDYEGIHFQ
jgi:cation diffusion facilitator CzcD-associated flavoprotein CzcO